MLRSSAWNLPQRSTVLAIAKAPYRAYASPVDVHPSKTDPAAADELRAAAEAAPLTPGLFAVVGRRMAL
jgi:hypothetical protein